MTGAVAGKRRAHEGGFTLVELVLAVAIFSAIVVGTNGLIETGLTMYTRNEQNRLLAMTGQNLVASMERDIRQSQSFLSSRTPANGQPLRGSDMIMTLDLPARYVADPANDPIWKQYWPAGQPAVNWLWRRVNYYTISDATAPGGTRLVRVTQYYWRNTVSSTGFSWPSLTASSSSHYVRVEQELSSYVWRLESDHTTWNTNAATARFFKFNLYLRPPGYSGGTLSYTYRLSGGAYRRMTTSYVDQNVTF